MNELFDYDEIRIRVMRSVFSPTRCQFHPLYDNQGDIFALTAVIDTDQLFIVISTLFYRLTKSSDRCFISYIGF